MIAEGRYCLLLLVPKTPCANSSRDAKRNYKKAGASPGIAFVSTHEVF